MVSGDSPVGGWSLPEAKQGPGGGQEEMEPTAHLSLPRPRPTPTALLGAGMSPREVPTHVGMCAVCGRNKSRSSCAACASAHETLLPALTLQGAPGVGGSSAWRRRIRCDASGRARLARAQGSWCSGHGNGTARTGQLPAPRASLIPSSRPPRSDDCSLCAREGASKYRVSPCFMRSHSLAGARTPALF